MLDHPVLRGGKDVKVSVGITLPNANLNSVLLLSSR